ncbi:hypothetical protein RD792_012283 [Penstemon davidsonii]|uniref:Uncharacterized protein n=1 Tax=Penstemon davidsonii TaxID=160366 RepID=A0ABR0CXT8_9LAMI|nr:hypothetical protein RD792_012283 [Penstemon davidsonii]
MPREDMVYVTHIATTAAGRQVSSSVYYDLANGTAQGGSFASRIAMCRVCLAGHGCLGYAILKSFEDAISYGVDILSVSIASEPGETVFTNNPIAIGAFNVVEQGIIVVCCRK